VEQISSRYGSVGKGDLHIHTARGDGMADIPEILTYVEGETDLSVIAITEHDDLSVAHEAREYCARGRYRCQVVVGVEITTLEGHLLALFLEEPVPSLQPLRPTLEAVHRKGGLCIIPHPMSWLTRSIGRSTIEGVLREGRDEVYFDGIETANMSPGARVSIEKARRLNERHYHLAAIGGSDAHFLTVIGSSYTLFPGSTVEDLRQAILQRTTRVGNGRYPSLAQIGLGQVVRQTWRGMTATPRKMGWGRTIWSFIRRVKP
jgi:predicted metal-dependent phosphoesterase TrpH